MLRIIASLSTPVNLTAHGTHTCGPNGDFTSTSHQPEHAQVGRLLRQKTFTESQGFCSSGILWPLAHDAKLVRSQNKTTDYRIHSLRCHACAPVRHLSCSSSKKLVSTTESEERRTGIYSRKSPLIKIPSTLIDARSDSINTTDRPS